MAIRWLADSSMAIRWLADSGPLIYRLAGTIQSKYFCQNPRMARSGMILQPHAHLH